MIKSEASDLVDVVVVGGGSAGLSGALALGRSRRSVVVVDAGEPRNGVAAHMQGYLGHDGVPPLEFLEIGRKEVAKYGVEVRSGRAVSATQCADNTIEVSLDTGQPVRARRLLVATGFRDVLPDIDGLRGRWGNDAIHCPYCHGWEAQDTNAAVISTGPMGVHGALLLRQWTDRVTLFIHNGPSPTEEESIKLVARGIKVVTGAVAQVVVEHDRIAALRMQDGRHVPIETVLTGVRADAFSPVLASLGLEPVVHPMGAEIGAAYEVSPTFETIVPGVWAVGNVVEIGPGFVASVVSGGYIAGAMINANLIEEETQAAVADYTAVVAG